MDDTTGTYRVQFVAKIPIVRRSKYFDTPKGWDTEVAMTSASWVELVQSNSRQYGAVVAGIDPSLPDLPAFLEQDDHST